MLLSFVNLLAFKDPKSQDCCFSLTKQPYLIRPQVSRSVCPAQRIGRALLYYPGMLSKVLILHAEPIWCTSVLNTTYYTIHIQYIVLQYYDLSGIESRTA